MSDAPAPRTVEETLRRLEALVEALQGPDLPLDEALRGLEEGVHLVARCREMLSQAEGRLEELTREGNRVQRRPLDL